jgi:penicillin-binding protein 2A
MGAAVVGADRRGRRGRVLRRIGFVFGALFLALFTALSVLLFGVFKVQNFQSLSRGKLEAVRHGAVSFYDDAGVRQETAAAEDYTALAEIPAHTRAAFIAAEDKRFYRHKGVDLRRVIGAAVKNIRSGSYSEGASTISQQLIKNTHLSEEKTLKRKLEEVKLALELERRYDKERILEYYLNAVYFGGGFYGVTAAARGYFGKAVRDLTLPEAALLAGVLPSPERYSPHRDPAAATARRNLVLRIMLKTGAVDSETYAAAVNAPPTAVPPAAPAAPVNDYLSAAAEEASELTGIPLAELSRKNYAVHTYLDADLQQRVTRAVTSPAYRAANGGGVAPDRLAVALDSRHGGIRAYYGESAYALRRILRQPGSAIKPVLVYAPALECGAITPEGKLCNEPCDFNGYRPENHNRRYSREISVRQAVAESANIPAVRLLDYTGIPYCKETAAKSGITFGEGDDTLALALGGFTYGVTPIQLTNAYMPFANGGMYARASFVKCIYKPDGTLLYRRDAAPRRALSEKTARAMDGILRFTAREGTAKKLSALRIPVGAKTGTVAFPGNPDLNNDAWCIAYTPEYCLGAWYGNTANAEPSALKHTLTGGSVPAALCRYILTDQT